MEDDEIVSITGPVEEVGGRLMIRIPLWMGGRALAPLCRSVSTIEDDHLVVIIRPWLAQQLRIGAGSVVDVDNRNGKFTITRSDENDAPDESDDPPIQ